MAWLKTLHACNSPAHSDVAARHSGPGTAPGEAVALRPPTRESRPGGAGRRRVLAGSTTNCTVAALPLQVLLSAAQARTVRGEAQGRRRRASRLGETRVLGDNPAKNRDDH